MVKIKDGYVMSARERAEYERQNALPRKKSGRVAYYFKPQTKYPPRIYAFIHAETWCDRNRRPMGLHKASPFLTRPMSKAEIEYHHFDWRLCYHQYEDWDRLLSTAEQEAEELDADVAGIGTNFLNRLKTFVPNFPLKGKPGALPPVPPELPPDEETQYLRELIATGGALNAAEVGRLLDEERQGQKRPVVLNALCQLYQNFGKPADKRNVLDETRIRRKVEIKQQRSRRNFVRRVYAKNPLFAIEEIRKIYPGYTEAMLSADLLIKPKTVKRKKRKPVTDLRGCQLQKLAHLLKDGDLNDKAYHDTCNKIVLLQNAHRERLPIPLVVKLQGKTLVYDFAWRTREGVVKFFVELANREEMTHAVLREHYQEIQRSSYSY